MLRLLDLPIHRQRLSIEAVCPEIDETLFEPFLKTLANRLSMTLVAMDLPLRVELPNGQGIGVHVHSNWVESGADLYSWLDYGFLTLEIYSCRRFDNHDAEHFFVRWFRPRQWRVGEPSWSPVRDS